MAMEKNGRIDETTPPDVSRPPTGPCKSGRCGCRAPATKQAADKIESHPATRVADAVTDQTKR